MLNGGKVVATEMPGKQQICDWRCEVLINNKCVCVCTCAFVWSNRFGGIAVLSEVWWCGEYGLTGCESLFYI